MPGGALCVADPEPNTVQGRKVCIVRIVLVFCSDAMRYVPCLPAGRQALCDFNIRR